MKLLLLLFATASISLNAQELYEFDWVNLSTGNAFSTVKDIATDDNGNIFHCGVLTTGANIDFNQLDSLNPGNWENFGYLSKVDADGNFVWGHTFDYISSIIANPLFFKEIKIAPNGDLLCHGSLTGEVDIDPSPDTLLLSPTAGGDPFIARFSNNGELLWARVIKSAPILQSFGSNFPADMDVDKDGGVILTGSTSNPLLIELPLYDTIIQQDTLNPWYRFGYTLKFSSAGDLDWFNCFNLNESAFSKVLCKPNGNVIVSGYFRDDLEIISQHLDTVISANYFSFLVEIDVNGSILEVKRVEMNPSEISSICMDSQDNMYLTGHFVNGFLGHFNDYTTAVQSHGGTDVYIVKYSPIGDFLWGKSLGSNYENLSAGLYISDSTMFIHVQSPSLDSLYLDDEFVYSNTLNSIIELDLNGELIQSIPSFEYPSNFNGFELDVEKNIVSFGRLYNSVQDPIDFDLSTNFFHHDKTGYAAFLYKNSVVNEEVFDPENYVLFPNPTSGMLKFYIKNLKENASIQIYSMNGAFIREIGIDTTNFIYDIGDLANGMYVLQIQNGEDRNVFRVVKK